MEHQDIKSDYLSVDIASLLDDYDKGDKVGEPSGVNDKEFNKIFSWMRGFVSAWLGWPNSGKTRFGMFMSMVKAVKYGSKFCVWPPEQIGSSMIMMPDGKRIAKRNANNLHKMLAHMYTGKTPYKHWKDRYGKDQMALDEYMAALDFIDQHFFVIDPKDKDYKTLFTVMLAQYEINGCDGFWFDPAKNIILEDTGRGDRDLDRLFDEAGDFALEVDGYVNFIAHGKADKTKRSANGARPICTQDNVLGGASWDNNMDQIFSWHRPYEHLKKEDPAYSTSDFYNLKQRDEELTNVKGMYLKIDFDFLTNRYYFNGVCPIDDSLRQGRQSNINFQQVQGPAPF